MFLNQNTVKNENRSPKLRKNNHPLIAPLSEIESVKNMLPITTTEVKTMAVRLEFNIKNNRTKTTTISTPRKFTKLVTAIFQAFPNMTITTKEGIVEDIEDFPTTEEEYKKNFDLVSRNTITSRIQTVCFKLTTDQPLSRIRNEEEVRNTLIEQKMYLKFDKWDGQAQEIVSLGWIKELSPRHHHEDKETRFITTALKTYLHTTATIKLFRTSPTAPSANANALRCKTQAFEIQCETKNKNELSKALVRLFKNHAEKMRGTYVPYKLKYTSPETY